MLCKFNDDTQKHVVSANSMQNESFDTVNTERDKCMTDTNGASM